MHLFKRQRTPPELVLKCCNNYEDLARSSSNQSARAHALSLAFGEPWLVWIHLTRLLPPELGHRPRGEVYDGDESTALWGGH